MRELNQSEIQAVAGGDLGEFTAREKTVGAAALSGGIFVGSFLSTFVATVVAAGTLGGYVLYNWVTEK